MSFAHLIHLARPLSGMEMHRVFSFKGTSRQCRLRKHSMMSRLEGHGSPDCHDTETLTTCHSNYGLKCEASVQNRQVWFWRSPKKKKQNEKEKHRHKQPQVVEEAGCVPKQSPHQIMCSFCTL